MKGCIVPNHFHVEQRGHSTQVREPMQSEDTQADVCSLVREFTAAIYADFERRKQDVQQRRFLLAIGLETFRL